MFRRQAQKRQQGQARRRPAITYTEAASEPQFQNLPDKYGVRAVTMAFNVGFQARP